MQPINDNNSDLSLVYLKEKYNNSYPYCKVHGAMLKVSGHGIWRCVQAVNVKSGKVNVDCRAGCVY